MSTCKTCRWWGSKPERHGGKDRGKNAKVCGSPRVVFGEQSEEGIQWEPETPGLVILDEADNLPIEPDMAAVLDGSGYFAELRTGPDFGCVHHEDISGAGKEKT